MPYKFKVGDRVNVSRRSDSAPQSVRNYIGRFGRVKEYKKLGPHDNIPYLVRFRGSEMWFNPYELEAAPKTRKKRGK